MTEPETEAILSSSFASPILTVVPLSIVLELSPLTVTAFIVCVPVRYVPLAIVWSEAEVLYVVAPFVVTEAVRATVAVLAVADET